MSNVSPVETILHFFAQFILVKHLLAAKTAKVEQTRQRLHQAYVLGLRSCVSDTR